MGIHTQTSAKNLASGTLSRKNGPEHGVGVSLKPSCLAGLGLESDWGADLMVCAPIGSVQAESVDAPTQEIFSTCSKLSSTGVSLPKMETSTVSFCVAGSTSETTAGIVAKGPSVTVT